MLKRTANADNLQPLVVVFGLNAHNSQLKQVKPLLRL